MTSVRPSGPFLALCAFRQVCRADDKRKKRTARRGCRSAAVWLSEQVGRSGSNLVHRQVYLIPTFWVTVSPLHWAASFSDHLFLHLRCCCAPDFSPQLRGRRSSSWKSAGPSRLSKHTPICILTIRPEQLINLTYSPSLGFDGMQQIN